MNTQTLNIALPKDLIKKADQLAKKEYRNRSELIREALRKYIEEKEEWEQIFKAGEETMAAMKIKTEDEVNNIVHEFRHQKKSH